MASSIVKKMLKHKMGGVKKPSEAHLTSSQYAGFDKPKEALAFRPGMKSRSQVSGPLHSKLPIEHDSQHLQESIGGPTTKRPRLKQPNRFAGRMRKPSVFPARKVV